MSHLYNVTITFESLGETLPDFSGSDLDKFNVSELAVNLWSKRLHIDYHEVDEEVSFIRTLARFIQNMQNIHKPEDEDSWKVKTIDWDGLEDYIDETNWTDELDVFPNKDSMLLSTHYKANEG